MAGKRRPILVVTTRIVVCLVILLVANGIFWALYASRPMPELRTEAPPLRRVVVMQAQPVQVRRQFEGYGTAMAMDTADIPARVTALVTELAPDLLAGQAVRAGQLIARLDPSDFARQVEIAENNIADFDAQIARLDVEEASWTERVDIALAEVALLDAELQRVKAAQARDAAKAREVEIAQLAMIRAQRNLVSANEELAKIPTARRRLEAQRRGQDASRRLAQFNLDRCEITSPIDGIIQTIDVEVGEQVPVGQRIARVVNLERVEVPIQVPASARPHLAPGDEVWLESAGNSRQTWRSAVSRIAPEDDETARSETVYVELHQDPAQSTVLAPGKFVRAQIHSARSESRWIVPRRSLRNDRLVQVVDGLISSGRIEIDYQLQGEFSQFGLPDTLWLVLDPSTALSDDALVVVDPSRALADGLRVEPVNHDQTPAQALTAKEPAR
jgi:RND family efflux transporter MFP subunit